MNNWKILAPLKKYIYIIIIINSCLLKKRDQKDVEKSETPTLKIIFISFFKIKRLKKSKQKEAEI